MGCWYPLLEILSKALGKCKGHQRWREEDQRMNYAMAYPPGPPTETHYMRPGARTVTFSGANSVHMIPSNPQGPEPQHQAPPPQHQPDHQPQPEPPGQGAPEQGAPPPQAEQPRQPKRGKKKLPRRVRFGPDQQPPQHQQEQQQQHPEHVPGQQQPEHAPGQHGPHGPAPGHQHQHQGPHGPPGYFRYTPSPLPRWEATPRRHEYFSGEYRYSYPTPVREGIYSMATDANRLTTIFSEENPNACVIA